MEEQTNGIIDLSYLELTFKGNKVIINKILRKILDNAPNQLIEIANHEKEKKWQ